MARVLQQKLKTQTLDFELSIADSQSRLFILDGNIMKNKDLIRKNILRLRSGLSFQSKRALDANIIEKLTSFLDDPGMQTIHCYLPMVYEINIRPVIQNLLSQGRTVICPKTLPVRQLEHLKLESLDQTETGIFGTSHPTNTELYPGGFDVIIVPGLAFDREGNRLGYGGGYYDRFLAHHPHTIKVGLAYPFQILESIPTSAHDIPIEKVIS